jgi:hypothetical protein
MSARMSEKAREVFRLWASSMVNMKCSDLGNWEVRIRKGLATEFFTGVTFCVTFVTLCNTRFDISKRCGIGRAHSKPPKDTIRFGEVQPKKGISDPLRLETFRPPNSPPIRRNK